MPFHSRSVHIIEMDIKLILNIEAVRFVLDSINAVHNVYQLYFIIKIWTLNLFYTPIKDLQEFTTKHAMHTVIKVKR